MSSNKGRRYNSRGSSNHGRGMSTGMKITSTILSSSSIKKTRQLFFAPLATEKSQYALCATVKETIMQHVHNEFDYGADLAKSQGW